MSNHAIRNAAGKTRVVDLGTKRGGALDVFREHGHEYFGEAAVGIQPGECLGVDRSAEYAEEVRAKGYGYLEGDVLEFFEQPVPVDFYLAFDFLEHMPDKATSQRALERMLQTAQTGVWLRMPSFELDLVHGEGRLRALGLRFAWTHWVGHPSHYLVDDAVSVIKECSYVKSYTVSPGRKITSTADPSLVPIDAPIDTVRYETSLGPKRSAAFDPPVYGQWEVRVRL
jgi:hypothetical protein